MYPLVGSWAGCLLTAQKGPFHVSLDVEPCYFSKVATTQNRWFHVHSIAMIPIHVALSCRNRIGRCLKSRHFSGRHVVFEIRRIFWRINANSRDVSHPSYLPLVKGLCCFVVHSNCECNCLSLGIVLDLRFTYLVVSLLNIWTFVKLLY